MRFLFLAFRYSFFGPTNIKLAFEKWHEFAAARNLLMASILACYDQKLDCISAHLPADLRVCQLVLAEWPGGGTGQPAGKKTSENRS